MKGLGTLLNVLLVIAGGLVGLVFGKKISKRLQDAVMLATGIAIMFLAAGGTLEKMLVIENGTLKCVGTIMMIVSLSVGTLVGELLQIDQALVKLGEWLKIKTKSEKDDQFVSAFVDASCVVCIGAMAIVGSINDGIYGDYSILLAKGILDFIIIAILTALTGKGAIFSFVPIFLFQGFFTVLAVGIEPILTDQTLNHISYIGNILIFCIGINQAFDKKIRVANMLPALLIGAIWAYF